MTFLEISMKFERVPIVSEQLNIITKHIIVHDSWFNDMKMLVVNIFWYIGTNIL